MLLRVGTDQGDSVVAEVTRCPHWAELGINEVGTAARVRRLTDFDQFLQLAFLGVDDGDLVGGVGRIHEVAMRRLEAAVMQERRRFDHLDLQVVQVAVVDRIDHAGFLHVNEELRVEVRGNDGGYARLRMIGLGADGHAASGDDLARLERIAVHDHELWRPVGAGNRVFVFVTLCLRAFDRACFHADLDFGDRVRFFHPQVDQVDLGVAADHEHVAARSRHARDVDGVASVQDADDLLAVAVDQGDFTGIAQGHREQVRKVEIVHLLFRTLLNRNDDLPRCFHFFQAEFRRCRRRLLDVTSHQVDFIVGQDAGSAPIRHATG